MTYMGFHMAFTLPPLLVLLLWTYLDARRGLRVAGSMGGQGQNRVSGVEQGDVGQDEVGQARSQRRQNGQQGLGQGRVGQALPLHNHSVGALLPAPTPAQAQARGSLSSALAPHKGIRNRYALGALALHVLIALVYTTPWDNYLVAREIWGYGRSRVLFTIGYVPFEEYLFFVLQALLTGFFLFTLARYYDPPRLHLKDGVGARVRLIGAVAFLLLSCVGFLALSSERGSYFGLIAIWAAPVLALQWGFGGDLILSRWRLLLPGLGLPTLHLWSADRYAIRDGIWWISEPYSSGLNVMGLPLEEALFFLVTNLLLGFGLTLVLEPQALTRLEPFKGLGWWRLTLGLWALSMIPTPLIPDAFAFMAYLSTALLALGTLGYALERYGRKAFLLFTVAFTFGVLIEWLGKTTGFPFGAYSYTAPGLAILGVPLLVPLGWWAFTLIALAVSPQRGRLWLAPLALVAWDLGLDPLMVTKGFWAFEANGFYYGIPISNFIGWYFAGVLLVGLLLKLEPRLKHEAGAELQGLFLVQAFLMTLGLVFFGLPLAGLVTLVAMGLVSLPLWRQGNLSLRRIG